MPTVLGVGRYRFSFFSNEGNESPHIHVKAAGDEANTREINEIERLVQDYQEPLREAWHDYFR